MGTKYSSNSSSGYNSSPPADDGSVTEANKVKWDTIKTKLADPVKTLADTINSELATHFDTGPVAVVTGTTLGSTHYNQVIEANTTSDLTLSDASSLGAGWFCDIHNLNANAVNVLRATASDTIDATSADTTVPSLGAVRFIVNAAATGFITEKKGIDNVLTTAGDILYASAAKTAARLAIGNPGQVPAVTAAGTALSYWAPNGHIYGLTLSNDTDTDHDISVAAGEATNSANDEILKLTSAMVKRIDAVWSAGTGNGGISLSLTGYGSTTMRIAGVSTDTILEVTSTTGMDAGDSIGIVMDDETTHWTTIASVTDSDTVVITIGLDGAAAAGNTVYHLTPPPAINTWYHVFLVKIGGAIDVLFDTSVTCANGVTDHGVAEYRRIGSVLTDGSANILAFKMVGDRIMWTAPVSEIAGAPPTSVTAYTVASPLGVECAAIFGWELYDITSERNVRVMISHPDQSIAASSSAMIAANTMWTNEGGCGGEVTVLTNTSSQVDVDSTSTAITLYLNTIGYIDYRGNTNERRNIK